MKGCIRRDEWMNEIKWMNECIGMYGGLGGKDEWIHINEWINV